MEDIAQSELFAYSCNTLGALVKGDKETPRFERPGLPPRSTINMAAACAATSKPISITPRDYTFVNAVTGAAYFSASLTPGSPPTSFVVHPRPEFKPTESSFVLQHRSVQATA